MKKKNSLCPRLAQAFISGSAQFAAIHSVCCGSQIMFAGMQMSISAASSHMLQGSSYIIAPIIAAAMSWGVPFIKRATAKNHTPQEKSCNHDGCALKIHHHTHTHKAPSPAFKKFINNTMLGYGVSFGLMALTLPTTDHAPEGQAKAWVLPEQAAMIVKVHDTTKIWPYSQRYFITTAGEAQKGQHAQLQEISFAKAEFNKAKSLLTQGTHMTLQGHSKVIMDPKDKILALKLAQDDAADFMKRKQRHVFTTAYATP